MRASRVCLGWTAVLCLCLPGCGLLIDAVEHVWPVSGNKVDIICERERVQVGLAMEPFRPFVFPTMWTDEGARVAGLDVELVRAMTDELSRRCGRATASSVDSGNCSGRYASRFAASVDCI